MQKLNLLEIPDGPESTEIFKDLYVNSSLSIKQIVSQGKASEPSFWYEQEEFEFAVLIRGRATIETAEKEKIELNASEAIVIPAKYKHRVSYVSSDAIWLAIYAKEA